MKTNNAILHLTVGKPIQASLARATAAMKAAKQGENGLVFAHYAEIVVDMKLPYRRAA